MVTTAAKTAKKPNTAKIIGEIKEIATKFGKNVENEIPKKLDVDSKIYQYIGFDMKITYSNLDLNPSSPTSLADLEYVSIDYKNKLAFDAYITKDAIDISHYDDSPEWGERLDRLLANLSKSKRNDK